MSIVDRFIARYGRLPTEFDPDYLEMLKMSKYIISDVPNSQPGKCANCGASKNDGRKYIDFGCQVDWYGAVVFCGLCLKDIALDFGLFSDLQEQLKHAIDSLVASQNLEKQGDVIANRLEELNKEIQGYYAGLRSIGYYTHTDSPVDMEPVPDDITGSGIDQTERKINSPKPRVAKQDSSSGPKNVPSLASLLTGETS